eukprot:comp19803_c0_seq1/m.38279 comp19803_c0_seq1/g.38279  ORF comp19803_c0_seq1/g.38279 comp19803_c0_seq1/m.38279 type:complete len:345 (+) comp19803_c0_seq1:1442-2476(+)
MRTRLEPVHQREQLRHNAALNLTLGLFALRRNRVNLIDKDDRRRILLGFLKCLAQIALGLSGKLGHDLRTIDQEEKGTGLVCHSARNQRLTRAGRAIHENALGRLDTDRLEQLRMAQRKLHQLADLRKLLAHTTNVVVANIVKALLVLALDRVALAVDHCLRGNNAVLWRIRLDDLELNSTHAAAHQEQIALSDRSVCLEKVRLEICLKQVAGDAFNRVVDGQDMDSVSILDVRALVDADNVSESHSEICAHHPVHSHAIVLRVLVRQHNTDRVLALLSLDQHRVAAENAQGFHRCIAQRNHTVVVLGRLVHNQTIRRLFAVQNRCRKVLFGLFFLSVGHFFLW